MKIVLLTAFKGIFNLSTRDHTWFGLLVKSFTMRNRLLGGCVLVSCWEQRGGPETSAPAAHPEPAWGWGGGGWALQS